MFSGGSGTKEDPYLIGSVADLNEMRNYDSAGTASYYKQICDIDFEWADWVSPRYFYSAYDGQGYKIMNVNVVGSFYASFFGAIYETLEDHILKNIRIINMKSLHPERSLSGGFSGMVIGKVKIKNCHLENVEIEGGYNAGGFVGRVRDAIIEHCSVSGKGTFEQGAGFCGSNYGVIRYCRTNMECIGTSHTIGGFVGSAYGLVEKCHAAGTIKLITTTAATGGVSAFVSDVAGTIRQCTTDVKIIGAARACSGFAGILREGCVLEDCYGKGDIDVEMGTYGNRIQVGGIVQAINRKDVVVRRCYFMGNIKVATPEEHRENAGELVRIGGIAGDIYSYNEGITTIKNCFSITPSITLINRTTGTEIEDFTRIGRIWGYYTDTTMEAHNYALDVATYNGSTTFPEQDKTLEGKDGQDITISALRKKETYENEGWDF
ncbi:MAG TPA: GLUG motif-containing protein, partial [Fervidobacterium sp.]|nr:GLUG motif-containing protein [Fervidobacterium sp.]